MREEKLCPFNIFDREIPEIRQLMITCDSFFHELRADGIGAEAHATECLSAEDEEKPGLFLPIRCRDC